jgi:hypothetical protein
VRPSLRHTPFVARWLGLRLMRCESCWRRFLLRRALAEQARKPRTKQRSAAVGSGGARPSSS